MTEVGEFRGLFDCDEFDVLRAVVEILFGGLSRLERQYLISEGGPQLLDGRAWGIVVVWGGDDDGDDGTGRGAGGDQPILEGELH